jgi:hypothetical protein
VIGKNGRKVKFEKMPKLSQKERKRGKQNLKDTMKPENVAEVMMKPENVAEVMKEPENAAKEVNAEVVQGLEINMLRKSRGDEFLEALYANARAQSHFPYESQEDRRRREAWFAEYDANQMREVNVVGKAKQKGKITIDSGAEESVYPKAMVDEKDLVETDASKKGMGFVAANGSKMKNYGAVKVKFQSEGKNRSMNFHVTDVQKPLGAVCRIADKGNFVCFGPNPNDNFIMNIESGEKMWMKRERGTYVIEVDYDEDDANSVFPRR